MNFERQILSLPLQKQVEEFLAQKQKIILVLNRKGEGSTFRCADCGWIYQCKQCNLPLIPTGQKTICFNCEKEFLLPEQCPKCQSFQLRPFGMTTRKLEKFVRDFWPQAKTIRIEKDTELSGDPHWDIAIATNFALKLNLPKIGLVGVIDADQGLNFPDFRSAEKTFQNLYKFLRLGDGGVIQTHLPENHVIKALAGLDFEKFFLDEITGRQQSNFPPFTSLVRLLYRHTNDKIAQQESQKVLDNIKKLSAVCHSPFTLLGPSSPFISRQRGFYYQQIIIKYGKLLPEEIKSILKTLPKGWIVDVDPFDLL